MHFNLFYSNITLMKKHVFVSVLGQRIYLIKLLNQLGKINKS